MQSSNPALRVLESQAGQFNFGGIANAATIQGTTTKAILLVVLTMFVGYVGMVYTANAILTTGSIPKLALYGSIIAAFVIALVTIFKPQISPITAPLYAIAEGFGLGCLSMLFELKYPGIVTTAVMSTFAVVLIMTALWKFKVVVPTAKFKSIMIGAISGVALLYIVDLIFSLFGARLLPTSGPVSIIISLVVCTIAAFSLILDFDNIQQAVDQGLPKYFDYFNAFSLLVTICWLYIEILRLLSKRE